MRNETQLARAVARPSRRHAATTNAGAKAASKAATSSAKLWWAIGITATLVAGAATAAILIRQDVAVSTSAQASDVTFLNGGGGVAGFATISLGSSGTSATLTLTGIPGAANFQVTDLLQISNSDATQAYTVTLSRSAAPNGAITQLLFTVLDGATTIKTFDAAAASSATAFTLPVSKTYDIRVDMVIADGTAAGSLGSIDLQMVIAPV